METSSWKLFGLVTFRGNRAGNRQPDSPYIALGGRSEPRVRTYSRVSVLGAYRSADQHWNARSHRDFARPGCVTMMREAVRKGSFMGLVFTISVECVGGLREWSLLVVTATGRCGRYPPKSSSIGGYQLGYLRAQPGRGQP